MADLIKAYPNKIKLYLIHKPSKLRGREGRFPDEKYENAIADMRKCDRIV